MLLLTSLLACTAATKSNTTKATIHQEHKDTITRSQQKILKPGLVASYDHLFVLLLHHFCTLFHTLLSHGD